MDELSVFDTHSWKMKKTGYNRFDEPISVAMCEKCLSSTGDIRSNNKTCREVTDGRKL